jgi:hypothetical protein
MWCPHCQSDVPQTSSSASSASRCLNCGRFVPRTAEAAISAAKSLSGGSETGLDLAANPFVESKLEPRAYWDDWKLAADVRSARRLSQRTPANVAEPAAWRRDEPHSVMPTPKWLSDIADRPSRSLHSLSDARQHRRICATAVTSGLVALGCGLALAIRANMAGASPNGHLGIPLMLLGVFGLLFGAVVQISWLARYSRTALDRMRLIELRLQEYRSTALLLGAGEEHGANGKLLARVP